MQHDNVRKSRMYDCATWILVSVVNFQFGVSMQRFGFLVILPDRLANEFLKLRLIVHNQVSKMFRHILPIIEGLFLLSSLKLPGENISSVRSFCNGSANRDKPIYGQT